MSRQHKQDFADYCAGLLRRTSAEAKLVADMIAAQPQDEATTEAVLALDLAGATAVIRVLKERQAQQGCDRLQGNHNAYVQMRAMNDKAYRHICDLWLRIAAAKDAEGC